MLHHIIVALDADPLSHHHRTKNPLNEEDGCPMSFLQELGAATVLNPEGEALNLHSTWQDKTTVLVFIRHFG